jgi:hypothetical protein
MFHFCNDVGIFFNAACILKTLTFSGTSQVMYCLNFTVGDRDFTVIHGNIDIVV